VQLETYTPPPGLPAAADPTRACLRRIDFERREVGLLVEFRGDYRTHGLLGAQRFEIVVTSHVDDEPALRDLVRHFRASFEAVPLDPAFLEAVESAGQIEIAEPPEDDERDIRIDMRLAETELDAPDGVLCGFYIDPSIESATPPHRYRPANTRTVDVQMHVEEGRARVRVFRGDEPTNRDAERVAVADTGWLGANIATPRVRVNGLRNGSYYWLRGGWVRL
jgi:hypothetical protein